jgi:putative tryptophan/tyrosine transport system substrate-binding protein
VSGLTRRQVVQGAGAVGVGLLAGCGQWPGQAQQPPPKVPTVGYVTSSAPDSGDSLDESRLVEQVAAFRQGLAELGYVEGQTVILEYRYTDGSDAQLREAAADLVRREVAVMVAAGGGLPVRAAKGATTTIPIVFTGAPDPVGQGQVASLARPGGNLTGLTSLNAQLSGKRLELLAQAVPGLRRVAVLWDPSATALFMREVPAAAQTLGLELQVLEVRDPADLEAAFEAASAEQADALITRGAWAARHRARVREPGGQQAVAHHVPG